MLDGKLLLCQQQHVGFQSSRTFGDVSAFTDER